MSMKSFLAQRSFTQTRLFGRPFTLEQLVGLFLRGLFDAAGLRLEEVSADGVRLVAGRPVRFAGEFADDALGEERLRGAFAAAGLGELDIALEPEAAGYRFARGLNARATVLIGDFGGGTSDFSVLRFDPGGERDVVCLGHAGLGFRGICSIIASIDAVIAPLLGRGDTYRVMGRTDLPVPPEFFASFARWHQLSSCVTRGRCATSRRLPRMPAIRSGWPGLLH